MNKQFASNLIAYIEHNNGLMEKYAAQARRHEEFVNSLQEKETEFHEKLAEAIEVLSSDGTIPGEYSDAIFNNLKSSPTKTAEFLMKVGGHRQRKMGESSSSPLNVSDPIIEFALSDQL